MASRLEKLVARRLDPLEKKAGQINEVYTRLLQSDAVKYAIGAMQPIDPEYTKNTYSEAKRVIDQLSSGLTTLCEYDFQGSVTNDTHIKAASDIDVLTLTKEFYTLEPPLTPSNPYYGDPVQHLLGLRNEEVMLLRRRFPEVDVDATGSKSIKLSGGSLRRVIDIVPSNWYDTVKYTQLGNKAYRGVHILDSEKRERLTNFPFLHNAMLEAKDYRTAGGLRKAIRLMKSLKYDADLEGISSYDICSITFNMADDDLRLQRPNELRIVEVCFIFCQRLLDDSALRNSLLVPNGSRKVFCTEGATIVGLRSLHSEITKLASDILNENRRSFTKLAEARVEYR